MTNILIPTDFTAASLQLAGQAVLALNAKNANIILFHAFDLPTSEFELLAPHRKKPYASLVTDSFRQLCKQFKDEHAKAVQKIHFKFMEGNTAVLFRNFVDANEIDLIVCPEYYQYTAVHRLSVDPRPLFKKAGIKVIHDFNQRKKEAVYETTQMAAPVLLAAN